MFSSKAILIWQSYLLFFSFLQPSYSSASLCNFSFNAIGADCVRHLDAVSSSSSSNNLMVPCLMLHLKHRSAVDAAATEMGKNEPMEHSISADALRMQTLFRRITDRTGSGGGHHSVIPEISQQAALAAEEPPFLSGKLMAEVKSGASLGSGLYLVDVFVGTPPRRFPLILDTGSDLIWIKCRPCHDCSEQDDPLYDPTNSSSYVNVSCDDPRCGLVASPNPPRRCRAEATDGGGHGCPYFYWYADSSNTTGDLAVESFTMSLTAPDGAGAAFRRVGDIVFGCGHRNRGNFQGAAGLLGLGRGALSFSSQLGPLYGRTFSYCFVDQNSHRSVRSKLIFGEDHRLLSHPDLNYTSFVAGKGNPAETFYYLQINSIIVGGEALQIPPETWELAEDGSGGTIIDSGSTLSYVFGQAYEKIKEAFVRKVKNYPAVEERLPELQQLNPCYNVSGVPKPEMPELAILFGDGARWNFPVENNFIRPGPDEIICLAMLPTTQPFSILGNHQQQNFHVLYDMKNSRLGFAPRRCAEM